MKIEHLPKEFASWLTINRKCNLRCKWCYASPDRFKGTTNMLLQTVQKSIDLFKGLPLKRVILIGGEPTIHPDFLTIVRMIKDANLVPVVITNGLKFKDPYFLQQSLDAGIAGITISLKGSSDEQYKLVTGRKCFRNVMNAVQNITKSGVEHNLAITVGGDLFADFDRMIDVVVKSGVKWFSLDMERPMISCNQVFSSDKSSPKQMADFFVSIYPKLEACGVDFVLKISVPFCLFPDGFIKTLKGKNRVVSGCHVYVGRGLIIDPDGKLLPCNHFCDHSLGNLGVDFSSGAEYLQFRNRSDIKEFYKTLASYPHENCQYCKHWEQCGAGCRINWLCRESVELIGKRKGGDNNDSARVA